MSKPTASLSSLSIQSPRKILYANSTFKLKQQEFPSRIPNDTKIVVSSPVKPPNLQDAVFDVNESCWKITVFPRKFPDSREDVKYLDEWLTTQLKSCNSSMKLPDIYDHGDDAIDAAAITALNQIVVLDLGFSEIVRQVLA